MLSLESPEWNTLSHAYGTAEDIPQLLTELEQYPLHAQYDDEPWHTLWSSLCHQSDIYSASFAAVPHIVRLAAAAPDRICSSFLLLPACIEASRLSGLAPDIPEHLAASYQLAIATLPTIVAACFDREWDDDWVRTATAALCVAKGHGGLATAILDLTPDIMESFSAWAHDEWHRQHPPIPAPPPPPPSFSGDGSMTSLIPNHQKANKALVPTAGAALSSMLSVTLTRHPVSTLTPAPAVGTA